MRCDEITSLDLNEKVENFIRNELKIFALQHPESKFNIICWTDELVTKSAKIINDYLAENECPSILKKGGDIIGKDRTTFYRLTKKEIL